jgi:pheromone a factor receptor
MSAEVSFGLKPWTSWSAVHKQFSEINTLSVSTSLDTERVMVEFTWWIIPVLSLVYIVFFVLGEICQEQCHSASTWIRRLVFKEVDSGAVAMPAKYI